MKTALQLGVCLAVLAFSTGCRRASTCEVTAYGPEYLTYRGSGELFNDACRQVLHELGYKEDLGQGEVRYPYHGEGSSSYQANGRMAAVKGFMQTKDEMGVEYKITILTLGRRDPVVILESTSSDRHKFINALNAEFHKRGIKVRQY